MGRDLSVIGRALSAPARSAMLVVLMDGSARPAGELAGYAGVGSPAASEHLAVLLDAGLLTCAVRGRQRYYQITGREVAEALEQLGQLCPPAVAPTWRRSREARDLAEARLCYDHLAGRLGVALTDALRRRGWLDEDLLVTDRGSAALRKDGIDLDATQPRSGRPLTRACPDWTERRPHVAGRLGVALAAQWFDRDWVRRRPTGRGLQLTEAGRHQLCLLAVADT